MQKDIGELEKVERRGLKNSWTPQSFFLFIFFFGVWKVSYSVVFPKLFAYPGACSTILPKMHCKQGEKDRERVKELVEKACMVDEH